MLGCCWWQTYFICYYMIWTNFPELNSGYSIVGCLWFTIWIEEPSFMSWYFRNCIIQSRWRPHVNPFWLIFISQIIEHAVAACHTKLYSNKNFILWIKNLFYYKMKRVFNPLDDIFFFLKKGISVKV